jgi:5-methylcytosine-specific restriction enzyme subunit McrC
MKQQVVLSEYSDDLILPEYELSREEREYLTKTSIIHESKPWEKRFYFDELKKGLRIKTGSWVGVIELERARIVIQPKFNKGFTSLMDMISFTEELPFYRWQDTTGSMGKTNFLEILVRLFLKEVERVLQVGLVKEYVTEADNLTNLRGRVDFRENLKQNFNLPTKIYCHYDELVTNIVENQILLSVLIKIPLFQLQPKTKQHLNRVRSQVELLCNEYRGKEWPKFHYHRLNAHYERVHKIGHYLWKGLSAKTFFNRQNFYYSFLINMNELFEKFVVTLLKKYLPKEYNVKAGKRITDAITLGGQSYRHIIPDIIVENKRTKETKVLDVKYKQYGKKRVDTSDVFQLAYYAQNQKREHEGGYESSIIYPGFLGDDWKEERSIELNVHSGYPGVLRLKPISIEGVLELALGGEDIYLLERARSVIK